MATTTTQVVGTIATVLSTELNSLASNGQALSSSAYSASGGYLMAEVELACTFPGGTPTNNSGVLIWFLRAPDGTNYEDGDASTTPARPPDVAFLVRQVTSSQRQARRGLIPPGTFKVLVRNDNTGQAMASSGNTVKILPLTYQNG
jgi:hypothetical protein